MTNKFANSFPAVSTSDYWGDRVVTQGHADYCAAHGHATHTVDGVVSPLCPRCGEARETAPVEEATQPMAPETLYVKSSGIRYTYTNLSWIAEAWNAYGARVSVLTDPAEIAAVIGDSNNMRA